MRRKNILYVSAMDYSRAKHRMGKGPRPEPLPGYRPSRGLYYSDDSFREEILDGFRNREKDIRGVLDPLGDYNLVAVPQDRLNTLHPGQRFDFVICHGSHIISPDDGSPSPILEQLMKRADAALCFQDGALEVARTFLWQLSNTHDRIPDNTVGPVHKYIREQSKLGEKIPEFDQESLGIPRYHEFRHERSPSYPSYAEPGTRARSIIDLAQGQSTPVRHTPNTDAVKIVPEQQDEQIASEKNGLSDIPQVAEPEQRPPRRKIRITSLSDKLTDDEILAKLKSIGARIRDTKYESDPLLSNTQNNDGGSLIEKRVKSTVIRRRISPGGYSPSNSVMEQISPAPVIGGSPEKPLEPVVFVPAVVTEPKPVLQSAVRKKMERERPLGGIESRFWGFEPSFVRPHMKIGLYVSRLLSLQQSDDAKPEHDPLIFSAQVDAALKAAFRHAHAATDWRSMGSLLKDNFYFTRPVGVLEDVIGTFVEQLRLSPSERFSLTMKLQSEYSVHALSDLSLDKSGYTSRGIIKTNDAAIKVDLEKRLTKEYLCYLRLAQSEFAPFCSSLYTESSYMVHGSVGFLPMHNLDTQQRGAQSANQQFGALLFRHAIPLFDHHDTRYNLFLMGLFHKVVSGFDSAFGAQIGMAPYEDLQGVAHHLSAEDPGINQSGEAYLRYRESRTLSNVASAVTDYNILLNELARQQRLVIIDGDWKPDNLYRGHKVDFACVGLGLEVDDIAYYCSDAAVGMNRDQYRQAINQYVRLRSLHDDDFRHWSLDGEKSYLFDSLADAAWLRQLVLRHAVMNKRDMLDDTKYQQRLFYKQRIEEALHDGDFSGRAGPSRS
jgi:hypothetical protein